MIHAVRCPHCQNFSRVDSDGLGQTVACPHCGTPFPATPDPAVSSAPEPLKPRVNRNATTPPVARRTGTITPRTSRDDAPTLPDPDTHDALADVPDLRPPSPATPGLIALALLPLGIPLAWLMIPILTGREAIFSFAAPVALALGVLGLCLGIVYAANWGFGTRVRAILMLVLLGYGLAGFLYFLKKEWAVAITKMMPVPAEVTWPHSTAPDGSTKVKAPTPLRPVEGTPLPGWPLATMQGEFDGAVKVRYTVAHGPPADAVKERVTNKEVWYDAAKKSILEQCGGELKREQFITHKGHDGWQYEVTVPDGATNQVVRIVRVFRVRESNVAFYLAAEGAFLERDSRYVKPFFDSFEMKPQPPAR